MPALRNLCLATLLLAPGCRPADDDGVRFAVGDPLPDHLLEGAGDYRVKTSELRSRVLLIHFFAADSPACRTQVGQIKSLWFPRRAAGMNVLGVCPETSRGEIARTASEWNVRYPVFVDEKRAFARGLAPRRYPWNVVVGRDGKILLSEKGDWSRVQAAVREAIRTKVEGPDHVRVQHLLVAFEGSVPGRTVKRSRDEAARLAAELLERAKKGDSFDELVKTYSDDPAPGIHDLANFNVAIDDDIDEAERGNVALSFGDVAFSLAVGEIGMAEYHSLKSRAGWHIIKRLN